MWPESTLKLERATKPKQKMETEMLDPFASPAQISTEFPKAALFKGRLILLRPTKLERQLPNQLDPDKPQDRLTVDITSVDGPIDGFEGREFKGVWINWGRVITQCEEALKTGGMVLARLDTYKPGERPGKGNPWGLIAATDAEKQTARDYLANRTVAAASAPAADENPFAKGAAPF